MTGVPSIQQPCNSTAKIIYVESYDVLLIALQEAQVWVPDSEFVWKGAVLLEDYTGQKELSVEDDNRQVSVIEDECYR